MAESRAAEVYKDYWAGQDAERGHPMLRARHMGFAIGLSERDAWFANMCAAMADVCVPPPAYAEMRDYFDKAATHMINRGDGRSDGRRLLPIVPT